MKVVVKQITKFFIIGVSAVLVDFVIYYLFSDLMGVNTDVSKGLGFMVGTVYTYFLNKRWTWRYTEKSNKGMLLKFGVIYAISFIFNVAINKYGLELIDDFTINFRLIFSDQNTMDLIVLKGDKFLAFFFATLVSAVINFIGQKFFVFNQVQADPKDDTNIEVF